MLSVFIVLTLGESLRDSLNPGKTRPSGLTFIFLTQVELEAAMDCLTRLAIAAGASSYAVVVGTWLCASSSQESCILSTVSATAPQNRVALKMSRSTDRGEPFPLQNSVKLPSRAPFGFNRRRLSVQFVSEGLDERSQKK